MKGYTNWRACVKQTLFIIGVLCFTFASGDDERPLTEWLSVHIGLFGLGTCSFLIIGKLEKMWAGNDRQRASASNNLKYK